MTAPTASLSDVALEDCGIVLGRRGAGKSNALMTLFERELDAGLAEKVGALWRATGAVL